MSIASEITRLQGVKADILTAIGNKGVTVPAGSALDDCPDLIGDIPSGGGDDVLLTYFETTAYDYTNFNFEFLSGFNHTTLDWYGNTYNGVMLNPSNDWLWWNTRLWLNSGAYSVEWLAKPVFNGSGAQTQSGCFGITTIFNKGAGNKIIVHGVDTGKTFTPGTTYHIAYVRDNDLDKVRVYFNGDLVSTETGSALFTFGVYSSDSTCEYHVSQLRIKKGDLSINGGNNYPVPTNPYV